MSPWQANCYLVTASEGASECVIIDPGITGAPDVTAALEERELTPVAILATHGHLDHVGDAHLLTATYGIPIYLDEEDQRLLTRPADGLGPMGAQLLHQLTGSDTLPAIDDVRAYPERLEVAGLTVETFAAPGHTRGSRLLQIASPSVSVVFSGDVLFAGSIGRTDLPGGSMSEMRETLQRIVEHFPADTPLLPGHGQATVLSQELATNPYLQPGTL
ncbi:MAG: MBL fold metallo-hydrolase [Propionibacteriaceae bacterium]|nr:MBL fold metallo-hydrolase [Propionibacteriaceae bacterium]